MRFLAPFVTALVVLCAALPATAWAGGQAGPARLRLASAEHLPLGALLPILDHLELQRHRLDSVALAYYQPQLAVSPNGEETPPSFRGQLWLRAPLQASDPQRPGSAALTRGEGLHTVLPVLSATPDVVEPLMYSLILATLHRRIDSDAALAREVDGQAAVLVAQDRELEAGMQVVETDSVPEHARAEVLMSSAAFGAHLLVLANEMQRSQARRRAQGKSGLCAQKEARVGLFSLWDQAFSDAPFPVTTFDAAGNERVRNVAVKQRMWVSLTLFPTARWNGGRSDHEEFCE